MDQHVPARVTFRRLAGLAATLGRIEFDPGQQFLVLQVGVKCLGCLAVFDVVERVSEALDNGAFKGGCQFLEFVRLHFSPEIRKNTGNAVYRSGHMHIAQQVEPREFGRRQLEAASIGLVVDDRFRKSVVYLAPTHALVDQVETDMSAQIGGLEAVSVVEDVALEELGERLPPFSVMTPERCLALLGFAPELFDKVGLLVFDEFHLISADDPKTSSKVSARAIDAMLALLTFLRHRKQADLLLLSAMVANGAEIARWLRGVTGREVEPFDDPWKPTRQLRSCVIYDRSDVAQAAKEALRMKSKAAQNRVPAQPLGLFSLISGWHPKRPEN